MKLDDLVYNKYNELNENDIYIWQYMSHHKNEIFINTLKTLANKINVSEASISRFAKKIGLSGFQELKTYLKWECYDKSEFNKGAILKVSKHLKETIDMLMEKDFNPIFDIFEEAETLYVYPTGEVQKNVAQEFKREFIYAKKMMYIIEGPTELDTVMKNANEKDAFLIISLSGENEMSITLAKLLKKLHIPSVAIAGSHENRLFDYCDAYVEFRSEYLDMGYEHLNHCSTSQFFVVVNFLFIRYLEYLQLKGLK